MIINANNDMEQIKNMRVRRGELWWADFGDKSLDSEYAQRRIVLIIQNDVGNQHSSTTISIPSTTRKTKSKMPTHVFLSSKIGIPEDSLITCEQVRCISKRRLLQKIADCPFFIMQKVEIALMRAEGTLGLYVSEEEAIQTLMNLNKSNTRSYQYENNYNTNRQVAYA